MKNNTSYWAMSGVVIGASRSHHEVSTRQGALDEEKGATCVAEIETDTALAPLHSVACTYWIVLGPRAGAENSVSARPL